MLLEDVVALLRIVELEDVSLQEAQELFDASSVLIAHALSNARFYLEAGQAYCGSILEGI